MGHCSRQPGVVVWAPAVIVPFAVYAPRVLSPDTDAIQFMTPIFAYDTPGVIEILQLK
jgi:hypothetical protein